MYHRSFDLWHEWSFETSFLYLSINAFMYTCILVHICSSHIPLFLLYSNATVTYLSIN